VLALASGVHPIVGALSARVSETLGVAPPHGDTPLVFADATRSLMRTNVDGCILGTCVFAARSGRRASHAAALIDATPNERCDPWGGDADLIL